MPTVIALARVPESADEEVLGAWREAGTLLRALRADAGFRFVALAEGGTLPPPLPFETRSGVYEIVHEDGAPAGAQGVTLVDPVEVSAQEEASFLAGWGRVRDVMAAQRGYLGTRLYRGGEAAHRFVTVSRWSSPLMVFRTQGQPALQEATAAMAVPSRAALYLVVADVRCQPPQTSQR